jgi:hypothetical protein
MRALLGIAAALVIAGPVRAADPVWHWIWVTPSPNPAQGWTTFEGDASVLFNGSKFGAELNGESKGWQPKLRVRGHIKGKASEAVVTLLYSDAGTEIYRGGYWRSRSKAPDPSAAWSSDRIWLQSGPNYLGLYRQAPSSK